VQRFSTHSGSLSTRCNISRHSPPTTSSSTCRIFAADVAQMQARGQEEEEEEEEEEESRGCK
jgi:hypothetical protein